MTAEAGQPDFDRGGEEEPVLYVADDGPNGPEELLRLVPAAGEPAPAEGGIEDAEISTPTEETTETSRALPT